MGDKDIHALIRGPWLPAGNAFLLLASLHVRCPIYYAGFNEHSERTVHWVLVLQYGRGCVDIAIKWKSSLCTQELFSLFSGRRRTRILVGTPNRNPKTCGKLCFCFVSLQDFPLR